MQANVILTDITHLPYLSSIWLSPLVHLTSTTVNIRSTLSSPSHPTSLITAHLEEEVLKQITLLPNYLRFLCQYDSYSLNQDLIVSNVLYL